MGRVVIGMDPHKRSATIEVMDDYEKVISTGRFGTDRQGYRNLLAAGRRWPERVAIKEVLESARALALLAARRCGAHA